MRTALHMSLNDDPPEEFASFEADTWTEWADLMARAFHEVMAEMGDQGMAVLARLRNPLLFGAHVPGVDFPDAARWSPDTEETRGAP